MSKWKCEICGSEFDNFHAQGFENKIYCPLCFFKKENQQLKKQLKQRDEVIDEAIKFIDHAQYDFELRSYVCGINFAGTMRLLEILQKYKGDNNE